MCAIGQIDCSVCKGAKIINDLTGLPPTRAENKEKTNGCICPDPKGDKSPFDGISYHCPLHGR